MTTILAAPVTLPKITLLVPVVDLLAVEEHIQPSHEKRSYPNDNLDIVRLHAG